MSENAAQQSPRMMVAGVVEEIAQEADNDPMTKRETLELVRAYYKISDPTVRKRLFELAKSLASVTEGV
jgi:hypothetical protein